MKYVKLQQDILKGVDCSKITDKKSPYMYGTTEDHVAICIDGYVLVFIPKKVYYLDNDKVFEGLTSMTISHFIKGREDAKLLDDTGIIKTDPKNRKCHILMNGDEEIWLDEKLLKYFDVKKDIHYEGTTKKAGVYVYEGKDLVGYVCPVNYWSK